MNIVVINQTEPSSAKTFEAILEDLGVDAAVNTQRPVQAFNRSSGGNAPAVDAYVVESVINPTVADNVIKHIRENTPDAKIFVLHYDGGQDITEKRTQQIRRHYNGQGADGFVIAESGYQDIRDSFSKTLGIEQPVVLRPRLSDKNIIQADSLHIALGGARAYLVQKGVEAWQPADATSFNKTLESVTGSLRFRGSTEYLHGREHFDSSTTGQYYNKFQSVDLSEEQVRLIEAMNMNIGDLSSLESLKQRMYEGPFYPDDQHMEDLIYDTQVRLRALFDGDHIPVLRVLQGNARDGYILNDNPDDFDPYEIFSRIENDQLLAELEAELIGDFDAEKELFGEAGFDPMIELYGPNIYEELGLPYDENDPH